MKKILKKNQIVICTVALMLIVAGYMNYTVNSNKTLQSAELIDTEKYADLGDATLVSSKNINVEDNKNVNNNTEIDTKNSDGNINIIETNANQANISNKDLNKEDSTKETALNNIASDKKKNDYFVQSKLDRNTMYSQMLESYQKILNNNELSEEQRGIAQTEIRKINSEKNGIMIAENLIKNKGFENVLIFENDDSINVIVEAEELQQEKIAQIQNIVQRELKAEIENIHISNK